MALKLSDYEYDLIVSNDTNSRGHTQWFYFQVSNTSSNMTIKFNIINLCKAGSLYNSGMKVSYRSACDIWKRGCSDISYFPNSFKRNKKGKPYYTITFTHRFEKSNDVVYFAYSQPYTYSNMMDYLKSIESDPVKKKFVSRRLLSYTIGGNRCDVLSITAPNVVDEMRKRKAIVISARVHPGETVGSWMMHGVLDFLTGNSPEAAALRENFVFKIIPMLNPDGVINGNYRCNLAGADLNRRWQDPLKSIHPTIFAAKKMIKSLCKERPVELICDLHGHSRRHNIFMYGCNLLENPKQSRCYPFILSQTSNYFLYKSCCFRMQKSKQSTMRLSLFSETRIPFIYTLEATFAGCDFGPLKGFHLTTKDLQSMGKDLCISILIKNSIPSLYSNTIRPQILLENFELNENLIEESNDDDSSGSDSNPSDDDISANELMKLLVPSKVKKSLNKVVNVANTSVSPRRDHSIRYLSVDFDSRRVLKKCSNCGEAMGVKHACTKRNRQNFVLPKAKVSRTRESSISKVKESIPSVTVFPKLDLSSCIQRKFKDKSTQTDFPVLVKKNNDPKRYLKRFENKTSKVKLEETVEEKPKATCKYRLFTYQYSFSN